MAINLGLNIKTNTKTDHTVSIVASSGVTLSTVNSSTQRCAVSATEDVEKEICTITFTANDNFYYSTPPDFKFNFNNGDLIVTSTTTENSLERVTQKVFVISAKASVNTIYNDIHFKESIGSGESVGVNNTVIKEISGVALDTSDVPTGGQTRALTVNGAENSEFSFFLKRNSDNKTYDFTSNTFTASSTTSGDITIGSSGVSQTSFVIPSSTSLDSYSLQLSVNTSSLTILPSSLSGVFTFNQVNDVTVTITCVSANAAYTGTHAAKPSSPVITGTNSGISGQNTVVDLQPKINTKAFKKAREIDVNDFELRTTAVIDSGTTGTGQTLTAANSQIVFGMTVTGTGISNAVTVAGISGTTLTLSGVPGGTPSGTLNFVGAGATIIQKGTGLIFSTTNPNEENIAALTIADVNKIINANSSSSGSATITLLTNSELDDAVGNVVGLYEGVTTIKSGANLENLTVNTVDSSNHTAVLNDSVVSRSGQELIFENAGRVADISFVLSIDQFPTENTVVSLNLDNFLTIDPNWS
tara:strand:- start:1595 stop:3181 length:1587 start_codon:yes stop_codon:yes gene_type:complete